jgi:SAM-dependent methyltransferase
MTPNQLPVLEQFYNERAKKYDRSNPATDPFSSRATAFLQQIGDDTTRLLDVGCGPGHLTAGLPISLQVVGVDLAPEMLRLAQAGRPTGRYFTHDFHRPLPEGEGRFDVIFASGAFDHCNDIGEALSALSGSLKENGLFYFTILEHRDGTLHNGNREVSARPERPDAIWLHFFTFQEVSAALAQTGLVPLSYQYAKGWRSNTLGISFDYGYWVVIKNPAAKGT